MLLIPVGYVGVETSLSASRLRYVDFVANDYLVPGVVGVVKLVGDVEHILALVAR